MKPTSKQPQTTDSFGIDFKREVYAYHKDLVINDRGYGGSITKRVRERFNITGDQVAAIYEEMESASNTTDKEVLHTLGEWKVLEAMNGKEFRFEIYSPSEHCTLAYIASTTKASPKANAELICKAVNNYKDLQEEQTQRISAEVALDEIEKQRNELRNERQRLLDSNRELKRILENLLGDVLNLINKNDSIKLGTMGTIHIVEAQKILKDEL
jgi:hypothetical protein